jgi:aspartyl-tRNA synthetase
VNEALGNLREKIAKDLDLYTCQWAPIWVIDYVRQTFGTINTDKFGVMINLFA